ncbi:MAG: hypothetical protein IH946_11970, partial [Bacteroidetes bacterium]|nr:hypothetical protein [Bacteroidota bacterium]
LVVMNPAFVMGPPLTADTNSESIQFMKDMLGGKFFTGAPYLEFDFVDVRDVVRVMIKLMESDINGERFLVSSENLGYKDVFDMIAHECKTRKPFIKVPKSIRFLAYFAERIKSSMTGEEPIITRESTRNADKKYFYDNSKIKNALHYDFIPVKNSIMEICAVFLENNGSKIGVLELV